MFVDIKIQLVEWITRVNNMLLHSNEYCFSDRVIYVIGAPEYSNLGDHAIAESQKELLARLFPNNRIVELTNDKFLADCLALKKSIKRNDIITVIGGGNFGNEYPLEHKVRMLVIKQFKDNCVIVFPQTIYYTDNSEGKKALRKDSKLISRHKNLHIMTREAKSYEFACKFLKKARVYFVPDTVLFLKRNYNNRRNDVLICLRSDKEVSVKNTVKEQILVCLEKHNKRYRVIDTVVDHNIKPEERSKELNRIFKQFSSSELVITDRLHGMIFAAITNTPCIVFPNYNYKVFGCYETIKYLAYIKFMKRWDKVLFEKHLSNLIRLQENHFYLENENVYMKILQEIVQPK